MDAPHAARRRLMLITPERVFYAGLLGRPTNRISNSFNLYVGLDGALAMASGESRHDDADLIVTPPNLRHTISSDGRSVVCIVIEPETVAPGGLERLAARLAGPERPRIARSVRAAYAALSERNSQEIGAQEIGAPELDRLCFGEPLPPRPMDPRVVLAIARITDFERAPTTATACAAAARLSLSRFLHLFREETGASFRAFRAWKRARHLLHYVGEDVNLARLAQDIGYPDSSHFSHSVRRFYGLKPRAIFSGSRELAVYRSPAAALRGGAKISVGAT